ncbi:MAG: EAL domain-containing protein [Gammaproteobacteria bacterium]|nr:EAL domain-containing protein [Gammaproteobacteria bacterium]
MNFFKTNQITFFAILGYGILLLLISGVLIAVNIKSSHLYEKIKQSQFASQKMQLATKLSELARSRTRLTGKMIYESDFFAKDEISLQLDKLASEFAIIRSQIFDLTLDVEEIFLLNQQASIVPSILPAQRKAAELALEDDEASLNEAQRLLYEIVLPGQDKINQYLSEFLERQALEVKAITEESQLAREELAKFNKFVFVIVTLVAIIFASLIIKKIRLVESALVDSKATTLKALEEVKVYENSFQSSGEAMIITDHQNLILNVNDAFEDLTGYQLKEIIGKNPKHFASGSTPKETYKEMWTALSNDGFWQGELWDRKKDGEIYPKLISISALKDEQGVIQNYTASFSDITERKHSEQRIEQLAHYDVLTGLYNRYSLGERLGQLMLNAKRNEQQLAVIFIDLDKFKNVNDTLGHHIGDKLLIEVAQRINNAIRESDIAARNGGDEFVVVLNEVERTELIPHIAQKILSQIATPYLIDKNTLDITPSMGISVFPHDGTKDSELLKNADIAMYHAKNLGKNNFQFYSEDMLNSINERLTIEKELNYAINNNQLELYYQPQICAKENHIVAVEALVRWVHPSKGMISPDNFIPIAEETGLIHSLGAWVMDTACHQLSIWKKSKIVDLHIAINLSTFQLQSEEIVNQVHSTMQKYNIEGKELEFEVTETSAMQNPGLAIKQLQKLRELGATLAIDDFGTGYSSLAYIKKIPIHILKIDKTFVKDIGTDDNDTEICAATLALAHNLRLKVVAEGVETEQQKEFLISHNCDYLQGFLYSKPLPANKITELLTNSTHGISNINEEVIN